MEQLGVSEIFVYAPANGSVGKASLLPTEHDAYGRLILGDIKIMKKKGISNGSDLYKILRNCKVVDMV